MEWNMDHDERMRIAEDVARRVMTRFPGTVLFGCVTGSVARGDDTEHSDIDTMFVTTSQIRLPKMSPDGYRQFIYRGVPLQVEFRTREEALEILGETGPYWPVQATNFLEPRLIGGDPEVAARTVLEFRKFVDAIPMSSFRRGAGHALLWMGQGLGKVRNAGAAGDHPRAIQAGIWMAQDTAAFLGLVNRRYYHFGDARMVREAESFPTVPAGLPNILARLFGAIAAPEIVAAAEGLGSLCRDLAREQGILVEEIDELEEVGL